MRVVVSLPWLALAALTGPRSRIPRVSLSQAHPDKGGDAERFKRINKAYEILKDEEKRRIYDEHGEEAALSGDGGGGGGDASSIFEMFGMGGGGGGRGRGPRKGDDIVHALTVTLEDLYNGKVCLCAVCDLWGAAVTLDVVFADEPATRVSTSVVHVLLRQWLHRRRL
ncbi:MAG: DnaJ domain-containing protein [Terracidiphilus sp.]|nr:DnaJ domain-containing protein [Terracidiphilus sp.]